MCVRDGDHSHTRIRTRTYSNTRTHFHAIASFVANARKICVVFFVRLQCVKCIDRFFPTVVIGIDYLTDGPMQPAYVKAVSILSKTMREYAVDRVDKMSKVNINVSINQNTR